MITGYRIDPASIRRTEVVHRPSPHPEPPSARPPALRAGPGVRPVDIGLSDEARGVLGNLPVRAQDALQTPFTVTRTVERCDWYYQGDERHLEVFVCYLASRRTVTVATGSMHIPPGHTARSAHWTLTCHQASVIGVRGL